MNMYCFGESTTASLNPGELQALFREAQAKTPVFREVSIFEIATVLDELSQAWRQGGDNWRHAFEIVQKELPFSSEMIAASLNVIPELLSYRNVISRLVADFGRVERLDQFVESRSFEGSDRAFPLGVLFHVSAGNVFLGAIDSLLMGFLTKNISIVKLSSRNLSFPILFAESLKRVDRKRILSDKFALIHFPGGSSRLEAVVKESAQAIIAWGGEEMIEAYKRDLPMSVKFIEYGPKISFQVITREGFKEWGVERVAAAVAQDIAMWDQAACASPQNLFLEDGIDIKSLMPKIGQALRDFPYPRGHLSDDECVEIWKEKARAEYHLLTGQGDFVSAPDFLLHFETTPGLRTSPLNRTLILKKFGSINDLVDQVRPFQKHLQSCGLLASESEEAEYLNRLGGVGIMRFAHLGQVMQAPIGAPHDGKMTLVELTRVVPQEHDTTLKGMVNDAITHVPFYHDLRCGKPITEITEMPLISGTDLDSGNAEKMQRFTHAKSSGGYLFSSGGTSGSPKYALYSHAEFSKVAELLALGFAAQGIGEGTVVANFFVAGNMWSSFLAVDQALAKLGARVLPIGGSSERGLVLGYLQQFQPEYLVGLPTQILELTRCADDQRVKLRIPSVLYAGEHLSLIARRYISEVFGTTHFGSAGYASVDAGPIGYQCMKAEAGMHHLFQEHVHLEVIDGEGVVTSLVKRQMPVIRLRTGDMIELLGPENPCSCGRRDPMFRLLGRANSQFHVWGCRLFLQEFEYALADCHTEGALFQVVIDQDAKAREIITLRVEQKDSGQISPAIFCDHLYQVSKDLRATHQRSWLDQHLVLEPLAEGGIERVARTGKIKSIVDRR